VNNIKDLVFTGFGIFFLILILFLSIPQGNAQQFDKETTRDGDAKRWDVDIVGFNYTNRIIDSFSVNGEGGGNVFLSSLTSGGGKSVCCITISQLNSDIFKLRVRWQVNGCVYLTRSKISGEVFENVFPYYKQVDVALSRPQKIRPQHLEVHFYPDGAVKAALTESLSLPRISLSDQRPRVSNFPRCSDDKKPE